MNQSGTAGSLTVVRIRGAESRHTLVVIDGVEMNSGTDGFFDFSTSPPTTSSGSRFCVGPRAAFTATAPWAA